MRRFHFNARLTTGKKKSSTLEACAAAAVFMVMWGVFGIGNGPLLVLGIVIAWVTVGVLKLRRKVKK